MRTIAIEEHFLADGFREMMRNAPGQGGGSNVAFFAEQQAKLADLGSLRLKDMDAGGIDLQVISHPTSGVVPIPGDEDIRLAREANDQLAAAVAAHPTRGSPSNLVQDELCRVPASVLCNRLLA